MIQERANNEPETLHRASKIEMNPHVSCNHDVAQCAHVHTEETHILKKILRPMTDYFEQTSTLLNLMYNI